MKILILKKMHKIIAFTVGIMLMTSSICLAQPGDPQSDPDNPVPIPGLAYLILGGLIIGIKKIIGHKNAKEN
jgi:hypothetical protein